MTLEDVYFIGQLVAAIAMLGSLLILILQVRDNSRMISASVYESAMTGYSEINQMMLEHPEILQEIDRLEASGYRAAPDMMERVMAFYRLSANHTYKLFRLYKSGVLPADEWSRVRESSSMVFRTRRAARIFVRRRESYFVELWPALGLTPEALGPASEQTPD